VIKQPLVALLIVSALAAASCSSGDDTSTSTLTTSPTVPLATENVSGTVAVGGSDVHAFTVATSGQAINVTLTAAGPPATIFMGIGVGAPVGSTCQLLSGGSTIGQAATVAQISGTINAGAYCLMVYDAGNQTGPVTYAATVTHY
jgi:hypothetical protein